MFIVLFLFLDASNLKRNLTLEQQLNSLNLYEPTSPTSDPDVWPSVQDRDPDMWSPPIHAGHKSVIHVNFVLHLLNKLIF